MGQINESSMKNWNNGDVMTENLYELERSVLIAAINDNFARHAKSFIIQNPDGSTKTTLNLDAAVNSVKFKEGTSIVLSLDNATGVLTISAALATDAVGTGAIKDNAVTTTKILDLNVTTNKLADLSVSTQKITDLAVTSVKLADGSVGATKIAGNSVSTAHLSDNAISGQKLADNTVGPTKLADGAVTGVKIANGVIGTAHLDSALFAASQGIAAQLEFDSRMVNIKKHANKAVGVDFTPVIQAAIDEVSTTIGGGIVFVPYGTFRAKNIQMKDNVTLVGAGHGTVLKLLDNSTIWDHVVTIGGPVTGANCEIRDIKIDGNQAQIGEIDVQMHGITIEGDSINTRIKNVWCANACGDGIWLVRDKGNGQPPGAVPTNVEITGCYFTGNQRQDISFVACKQTICNNNRCMGDGLGAIDVEPEVMGDLQFLTISGNYASFINVTTKNFKRAMVSVTGNTCRRASLWEAGGIAFSGNTVFGLLSLQELSDTVISGNMLKAIFLQPQASTWNTRLQILDNTIINENNGPNDPAISVDGRDTTIYMWRTRHLLFKGNTVICQGDTAMFIDGECNNIQVKESRFVDSLQSLNDNTAVYKQNTVAGDVNIDIVDNSIEGFYRGVLVDGSNKLSGGFVARNQFNCRGKVMDLLDFDNAIVDGNISIGNVQIYLQYCVNALVARNVFQNTQDTANLIELNGATNARLVRNSFARVGNSSTILIWNSENVFVDEYFSNRRAISVAGSSNLASGSAWWTTGQGPTQGNWQIGDFVSNIAPIPGGYQGWVCTTAGIGNTFAWTSGTAFTVLDERIYNGPNVYQCIQTGVSAAAPNTGPSGTGQNIIDGTVRWKYVGVRAVFKPCGSIAT